MILSLIGFMGCGKSSVGKEISQLLCCPFIDLDDYIEKTQGMSIPNIFSTCSEDGFRKIEKEALKTVLHDRNSSENLVISTGGGVVLNPENRTLLHEHTTCIYLEASAETLAERLEGKTAGRPILKSSDIASEIADLLDKRCGFYKETAHFTVNTDKKKISETLLQISEILNSAVL